MLPPYLLLTLVMAAVAHALLTSIIITRLIILVLEAVKRDDTTVR